MLLVIDQPQARFTTSRAPRKSAPVLAIGALDVSLNPHMLQGRANIGHQHFDGLRLAVQRRQVQPVASQPRAPINRA